MRSRGWDRRKSTSMAALVLLLLTVSTQTAAAQCGKDYRAAPTHSSIPGGPPLAIGDSVLAATVPVLVRDGFEVDGMVCRRMDQGLSLLQARAADLPHLVVLALGTNGEVTPNQIATALTILGPQRILVLVTPHGSVVPSTPQVIRAAAASHPGQVLLLDWDRFAVGHQDWFAPDGIHLSIPVGEEAYAQVIASVLPYAIPPPPQPVAAPVQSAASRRSPAHRSGLVRHSRPASHRPRSVRHTPPRTITAPTQHPAAGTSSSTSPAAAASRNPVPTAISRGASNRATLVPLGILAGAVILASAGVWKLRRRRA